MQYTWLFLFTVHAILKGGTSQEWTLIKTETDTRTPKHAEYYTDGTGARSDGAGARSDGAGARSDGAGATFEAVRVEHENAVGGTNFESRALESTLSEGMMATGPPESTLSEGMMATGPPESTLSEGMMATGPPESSTLSEGMMATGPPESSTLSDGSRSESRTVQGVDMEDAVLYSRLLADTDLSGNQSKSTTEHAGAEGGAPKWTCSADCVAGVSLGVSFTLKSTVAIVAALRKKKEEEKLIKDTETSKQDAPLATGSGTSSASTGSTSASSTSGASTSSASGASSASSASTEATEKRGGGTMSTEGTDTAERRIDVKPAVSPQTDQPQPPKPSKCARVTVACCRTLGVLIGVLCAGISDGATASGITLQATNSRRPPRRTAAAGEAERVTRTPVAASTLVVENS
jgi:hypothetical protein